MMQAIAIILIEALICSLNRQGKRERCNRAHLLRPDR